MIETIEIVCIYGKKSSAMPSDINDRLVCLCCRILAGLVRNFIYVSTLCFKKDSVQIRNWHINGDKSYGNDCFNRSRRLMKLNFYFFLSFWNDVSNIQYRTVVQATIVQTDTEFGATVCNLTVK